MPKHFGLSLGLLVVVLAPGAVEAQALTRLEVQGRSGQNLVLVTRAGSNAPFLTGDVLASVGNGKIKHFSPSGTLLRVLDTLDTTSGLRNTTGMAWDRSDNLYVTLFTDNGSIFGPNPNPGNVYKFDQFGNLLGPFGEGYNAHPESVVLDEAGNVYVGQADGQKKILKFSPQGMPLDSYLPGAELRGADWFDLAHDQKTIFYTSEGKHVKRFDLSTKTQLADFNATPLPGTNAYGLRLLPTGGLLVADTGSIVRLDANGNVVQQYTAPGENAWFALNLDPDGQTFWSGGYFTGYVYHFDIATGQLLTSWNSAPFTGLGGLTVFKEQTVAVPSFPPVLFVHGICSHADSFYMMMANLRHLNPQRFMTTPPSPLVPLCFDGTVVRPATGSASTPIPPSPAYTFAFANELTGSCREEDIANIGIEHLGVQLGKVIEAIRVSNGGGPVDLVGHSMGGLIIRTYLEGKIAVYKPGSVHTVVTIDTPHAGFPLKGIVDALEAVLEVFCWPDPVEACRPQIPEFFTCLLSPNVQETEMDASETGLFLDPLNHVDIPSDVLFWSVGSEGGAWFRRPFFGDGIVLTSSQDLKQVPHYLCATNVMTSPFFYDVPLGFLGLETHTTVTDFPPVAQRVDDLLRSSLQDTCQASIMGLPITIAMSTLSNATPGSPRVTITFAQGGSSNVSSLAAQACTADVIARASDGSELDRRTVVADGTKTVQLGLLTVAGWSLEIVTTCNETFSARVEVQPGTSFGSGRATQVVPVILDVNTGAAHYTSDVTLTNRGTMPAIATMRFTATSGEGSGMVSQLVPAGSQVVFGSGTDYLRAMGLALPSDGSSIVGTLMVDWAGLSDASSSAVLTRTTTITTSPQPGGAAGLAYIGVLPASTSGPVTVFGLRQNSSDRSNLAAFNPTPDPVSVKVTAYAGDGSGYSRVISDGQALPGYGWYQWNRVLDGTGITNGWATVERVSSSGSFNAYGVVNDNVTNDGSFITSARSSASGTTMTVPALVETGSFRSELVLANKSGNPVTLTLSYRESLSPSYGTGGSTTVTLRPSEQLIIPEAINYLRGRGISIGASGVASYAGALRISVSGASLPDVYAGARTASQSLAGGQFGLFTPGIYESEAATTDVYLYGLRSDELNRSNVAVANVGGDSSGPVTLVLHFFDGDFSGVETGGTETVTLAPGEWKQLSNILKTKGIRNGWVHVIRTSGSAPWFAYGVINDGGNPGERTGDGAYVPMVASGGGAGDVVISEFPTNGVPYGIVSGPDGNLWFTEDPSNIGRITTAGVITEFTVPTVGSSPNGIVTGPDGNLWFTERQGNKIGRIATAGVIMEFNVPTELSYPYGIASGPDGNLWFTELTGNKIGRITTAGVMTEFTVPTVDSAPVGITPGPDGNLWFAEANGSKVGRITITGVITEFATPTAGSGPEGIAPGSDGALWFTERGSNKIGRITTTGVIAEFPVPTAGGSPVGITSGPDGNLWFTEHDGDKIGRITTTGVITEFPVPTAGSGPRGIASGPDGNLWFTEEGGSSIGRLSNIR